MFLKGVEELEHSWALLLIHIHRFKQHALCKPFSLSYFAQHVSQILGLDVHVLAIQTCKSIISALWSWSCHGCNVDTDDLLTRAAGFCEFILSFD